MPLTNISDRDPARTGKTAVVIVAAGRGRRLGAEIPKQYLSIAGACALRRSITRFLQTPGIDIVRPVIHPDDRHHYELAIEGLTDPRLLPPVSGGETRAATTANGLESLVEFAPQRVLIHDAARPFVSASIITRVIEALSSADGAFAGVPITDSIWLTEGNAAKTSVPRDGLWRAQTPQGFDFAKILAAHRSLSTEATDDVAVALAAGMSVLAVEGSEANYKITVESDLGRATRDAMEQDRQSPSDTPDDL